MRWAQVIRSHKFQQYQRTHIPAVGALIDDPEALAQALLLLRQMEAEIAWAARQLHDRHGYSWAKIGAPIGMDRSNTFRQWAAAPETDAARTRREQETQESG